MITSMDAVQRALARARAAAEARMSETVDVGLYVDGEDENLEPTRELDTERYTGKARIRWASRDVSRVEAPAMPVAVQEPYLSIPFGSAPLFTGDEVYVSASLVDPILVGRRFTILGRPAAGQTSAHRYLLEEL